MPSPVPLEIDADKKFRKLWPIAKDIQSIRPKRGTKSPDGIGGVILEDIEDAVRGIAGPWKTDPRLNTHGLKMGPVPSIERCEINEAGNCGMYGFWARYGIPTFLVGCNTQEEWEFLKEKLREKGLIR